MLDIPVTFDYKGKTYSGTISEVNGAGGGTYHLTVQNHHWGALLIQQGKWRLWSNSKPDLMQLAYQFGALVEAAKSTPDSD